MPTGLLPEPFVSWRIICVKGNYNDAETRRWREFLEQDCDALCTFPGAF